MGKKGQLGTLGYNVEEGVRRIASWYDWRELDISSPGTDVDIQTNYPGLDLVGFLNPTSSPITVKFKTTITPGSTLTVIIAANGSLWPLPSISTLVASGMSDNVVLCFQKK
jgi:hypothetical protein